MKNLKKVLALGLALVMILGMFTIASAAETKKTAQEFPDWASVENKDAVSLMVDLGVINGMDDGTYSPEKNIDRASWAKMVFFVLTGENDAKIYASDYPALKDIANTWAQGYIEYLYSIECISGDTDGNYNPGNPISVVAAAKTMLTGLGYNSKIEGYENDANWATNIMNRAKSVGLLKGISLKQNDNITRDAAAQMVYNALSAKTQTAKYTLNFMTGERVPSGEYTEGETLGEKAFDIVKVTATVDSVDNKGVATLTGVKDADKNSVSPKGDVKASLKDMGKTVTLWTKSDYSEYVSTSVASGAMTAVKVDTDGVVWAKALKADPSADDKKDDDFAGEPDTNVNYYKNGVTSSQSYVPKTGDVVEYYDTDDNGKIDVVHVYAYTVAKLNADPASKTDKDGNTTVDLKITGLGNKIPVDQITGDWSSLKEGDIVLYYASAATNDALVTIEKAEKVSGKVSRVSGDQKKLTINSTNYTASMIVGADNATTGIFSGWEDYKNEYDFYLDKNGSIAIADQITDEATSDVALVLESAWVNAQGGIGGAKGYAQANLLFTDGTTQIVKVVELDGEKDNDLKNAMDGDAMLTGGETAVFVEASEDDGEWTLTTIADDKVDDIAADSVVEAKITYTTGMTADTETLFIVAKGNSEDGYTYTVHTGFAAVPGLTVSEKSYAYTKDGGAADYVYLIAETFTGDAPEGYVYFKGNTADYTNADKNLVYSVIDAKGDEVELTLKSNVAPATAGFYEIKAVNDDGVVTALKNTTAATTDEVTASGKGVFTAGTKSVSYDNTTVCVVIDLNADGFDAVSTFAPDSLDFAHGAEDNYSSVQALIVGEANEVADYIYVVRTAR